MFSKQFIRTVFTSTTSQERLIKVLPSLESITPVQLGTKTTRGSYFLPRTSKGNVPVYRTYRSQAVYTDVKRVQGDIIQLRNDIQTLFPNMDKSRFTCCMQSKTIKIKGNIVKELTAALEKKF